MAKYIHTFIMALTLAFATPAFANAASSIEIVEQDQLPVVSVTGEATLHVTNANGQMLYVYNVAGVCVQSFKVEGMDRSYELNLSKGCYIVKVGKTVRKVSIR